MYCGNCGQKLADHLQYCTRCGRPVEPAAKPKKKRRLLPGLLAFLLSAAVAFALQTGSFSPKFSSRLPSVPKELKEHAFLQCRDQGPCGMLVGNVGITVIFIDDADSSWSQEEIEAYLSEVYLDVQGMTHDAAIWGRELNVTVNPRQGRVSASLSSTNVDSFTGTMLLSAGLTESGCNDALEKVLGVEEAPVVFVLNKAGRASAQMGTLEEYCFLFDDSSAFRHELFHLFGAEDLYYPEEVTAIAENCFTESIMLGYDSDTVDDLTAYLIGWSNSLSEEALSFLKQTAYVTEEGMRSAYEEESYTGYGTKKYDDGTYTGQLSMGVPHGWGTMVMEGGESYEGEFVSGVRTGTGTYRWSNGDVYQGAFVENIRSGYGTFTWSSGDRYEGNFENDQRTGWGIYIWADGTRYEGAFLNDQITGTGTFYWTDGSRYSGEFFNGALQGQGTLTYPDGQTLTGTWHNNEYLG